MHNLTADTYLRHMNKILAFLFFVFSGHMAEGQILSVNNKSAAPIEDSVVVTGKVFNAKLLSSGMTLLNIGGYFPDHLFEILILSEDRSKFVYKPEERFIGKYVQVTGSFMDSKGKLQMTITDPAQLFEVMSPKMLIGPNTDR